MSIKKMEDRKIGRSGEPPVVSEVEGSRMIDRDEP
jgi:hypothetical protein